MDKLLLVLLIPLLLCGCLIYGEGRTIGYITTVEDTSVIFGWDRIWFRVETGTMSSVQSQPEAYIILTSNKVLKDKLLETAKEHQKIELIYQRHLFSVSRFSNDEVIDFKIIE